LDFYEATSSQTIVVLSLFYTSESGVSGLRVATGPGGIFAPVTVWLAPDLTAGMSYQFPRFVIAPGGHLYWLGAPAGDEFYMSGLVIES
jgi:hypothetical protein